MKATPSSKIYLAVIGPSDADSATSCLAEEVGAEVAGAGAILLTGGMGGVMEAASRGAQSAGGLTMGILAGSSRADANAYLDLSLPTGMGEMRNALLIRAADAVIAIGGGAGTLSEIALAVKLRRPIVGLGTWEAAFGSEVLPMSKAQSPGHAVALILELVHTLRNTINPKDG